MIGNTMTAPRRRRKPGPLRLAAVLGGAAIVGVAAYAIPIGAATTEYVVVDRNTGLAISGFDPVAYFIDGAPRLGKAEFEYRFARAVWRFRNEGNRAAFAADPEVYMPRFGGYDPTDVARGVAVPGDPRVWLVTGGRLYFFYREQAREAFMGDAERLSATADRKWPSVQLTLSP